MMLKLYRKGWFGGGVVEWTFYGDLAPATPGASVCTVYDCGIDRENRDCHFLLEDLCHYCENSRQLSRSQPAQLNSSSPSS